MTRSGWWVAAACMVLSLSCEDPYQTAALEAQLASANARADNATHSLGARITSLEAEVSTLRAALETSRGDATRCEEHLVEVSAFCDPCRRAGTVSLDTDRHVPASVRGYYRSDGTYVHGYVRNERPR